MKHWQAVGVGALVALMSVNHYPVAVAEGGNCSGGQSSFGDRMLASYQCPASQPDRPEPSAPRDSAPAPADSAAKRVSKTSPSPPARAALTNGVAEEISEDEWTRTGPTMSGAACEIAIREGVGGDCTVTPEEAEPEAPAQPAAAAEPAAEPPPEPEVDPAVAALSLIAEIEFSGGDPQIGPPADINPWGIAVVGYPYWFWTDGPTTLQASQESLGVEVTLDATATSVTFDTGDGGTVTCDPSSAPHWDKGVGPKQESPSCGYTWTERSATPSSPKSAHTVTATTTWEVNWTAGGESGTEVVQRSESADVVVGELQALVTS